MGWSLSNLGHEVARNTVANILKRHGVEPAPERVRNATWQEFLTQHWELLVAADFFTVEVWTRRPSKVALIAGARCRDRQNDLARLYHLCLISAGQNSARRTSVVILAALGGGSASVTALDGYRRWNWRWLVIAALRSGGS